MFNHHLITVLRNFRRFKTTTVISVLGLALGLACFIAALGMVTFLTHGESHIANADRIYVITEDMHPRNAMSLDFASVRSSSPVARYLRVDFPQLKGVASVRDVQDIPVAANERLGYLHAAAADPEFLTIFKLPLTESSAINPLSIARGAVVTEETAQKLFGSTHVLGRSITLHDAYDVTITGVVRAVPQPSHIGATPEHLLRFDILLTEETYWQFRRAQNPTVPAQSPFATDWWGAQVCFTYVLFPADGSFTPRMLNDQLETFTRRHMTAALYNQVHYQHHAVPIASMRMTQLNVDLFHGSGLSLAVLILSLAGIVLGVACMNYANLATAQALARARELGLRRVLGASGMQIASQQWIESGLQLLTAFAIALTLNALALTLFTQDATATIIRVASSSIFWIAVLATSTLVVLILGAYTAFVILRAQPVQALRGSQVNRGTGWVSRLLVGVQFATASVLIVGFIVVHAQNNIVRTQALQGRADPVVVVQFPGRDASHMFDALKETLQRSSAIREVSGMSRVPWSTKQSSVSGVSTEIGGTLHNALVDFVRYDFERTLATPLLAGRSFDAHLNDRTWPSGGSAIDGTYPIVIDRGTAMQFGWSNPNDAINRTIYLPLWDHGHLTGSNASLRIIGVAEANPLRIDAGPGAHLQIYALVPSIASNMLVRIDKNRIQEALATIDATWKSLAPYAPVQRHFVDELFEREYQTLQLASDALTALMLIGTGIATMGLFGMATFIAARRHHEIGVRKTLGASVGNILSLLLRDFSKPVVIANILIWPITFIAAQKYLDLFIQRIDFTVLPYVLSFAATLLIAWLAVGGQAWRAARVNPATTLRHE